MPDIAELIQKLKNPLCRHYKAACDECGSTLTSVGYSITTTESTNSEKQDDVVTQQNKIDQLTEEIKANNKCVAELFQRMIKNRKTPVTVIIQPGQANDAI